MGVVGGMLISPSFQTYFGIDPNDKLREAEINGTIVSVLQVGCLFGALLSTSTAGTHYMTKKKKGGILIYM